MVSGKDDPARPEPESAAGEFGPPLTASTPPAAAPDSEFGPSLNDFGPSLNDFGPTPENGPGWSPAPPPASPDLAWRPADAGPPTGQYPVPESWTPPATGQFPVQSGPAGEPAADGAGKPSAAAPSAASASGYEPGPGVFGDADQTARTTGAADADASGYASGPGVFGDADETTRVTGAAAAGASGYAAGPGVFGGPEETTRYAPSGYAPGAGVFGDPDQTTRYTGTGSAAVPPAAPSSAATPTSARKTPADPSASQSAVNNAPSSTAAASEGARNGAPASWWRTTEAGFPPTPPPEPVTTQGESLSWADDPIAKRLAPKSAPPEREPSAKPPWGRIAIGGAAVVVVLAILGAVIVAVTRGGGDDEPAQAVATTTGKSVTTTAPTAAALSCPTKREGNLTIGNGEGSTASGADAILGFQHAFYADRNGEKARSFVAPDAANVSPAEVIQQAINDVIPVGTTYCLRIVEVAPAIYDADLTEHRPDGTTTVYRQHITTVNRDGKNLIFAID
ncbi:hypothetical protein [Nocardia sp. NPDC127526]|uniref:hypothetical protein n=1 Tax=Nocardia sp. NPDC127526 TaxID=3345393 RepID=UPI003635B267